MTRSIRSFLSTGSSGAGTTTVKNTFDQIFRREGINAVFIEGDAFHRYNREDMRAEIESRNARATTTFSHFSYEANKLDEARGGCSATMARPAAADPRTMSTTRRRPPRCGAPPGNFTDWETLRGGSDLLFYEACTAPWSTTRSTSPR